MPNILAEIAGKIATLLSYDGTAFRNVKSDTSGRISVRGEDQIHSFDDTLEVYLTAAMVGADGYLEIAAVPEGEVWAITNIILENADRNITSARWCRFSGAVAYCFGCVTKAIGATERVCWHGWEWAKEDDTIRGTFIGSQIGDVCHMWITGHVMTKEA